MNVAFGTSVNYPPLMWLVSLSWGLVMFAYVCLRILILRKISPAKFVEDVPGLQMYATKFTMVSRRDSTMSVGSGYATQRRFSTATAGSGKRNSVFVPGTTQFDPNVYAQQQQQAMQQAQAAQNAEEAATYAQQSVPLQSTASLPSNAGHVSFT
jgi:hypothetical protein